MPEAEAVGDGFVGQPGRLGLGLVAVCGIAMAGSVWTVTPARDRTIACLFALAAVGVAAGLHAGTRTHPPFADRLAYPLVVLAQLVALGLVDPRAARTCLPVIPLAFLHLGLTCPPRRSWYLLVPAGTAWLVAHGVPRTGVDPALLVRLLIAAGAWVLVAELVARCADPQGSAERRAGPRSDRAQVDPLTGLPDRRALPQLLGVAHAGDALALIDVDHLRQINERCGPVAGDEVLRLLGSVLRAELREPDRALRYGGEELLLLLPGACTEEQADAALRRLRAAWTRATGEAGLEPTATFSGGIAILGDLESPGEAVRAAERQLHDAKQAGRDCWRIRPAGVGRRPVPVASLGEVAQ